MSDALIYGRAVAEHWQVLHRLAHGQKGLLDLRSRTVYYYLREPFYTAARNLGWDELAPGVGLSREFIEWAAGKDLNVRVFVEGFNSRCYEASARSWLDWCTEKHSEWMLKEEVLLLELPWNSTHFRTVQAFEDYAVVDAWRILTLLEARKI